VEAKKITVIPAKAGTHLDLRFPQRLGSQQQNGFQLSLE